MLINLSDVFNTTGKVTDVTVVPSLTSYDGGFGDFKLVEKGDLRLKLKNNGKGKSLVSGDVKLTFEGRCDRCLKELPIVIEASIDREFASPEFKSDDPDEDEELHQFMDGYQLDTEALLHDEITVNWPVKILCREDCKGLCPVCGHDLNEGDCGCDTFVPDPRMAAIIDKIKDSTKEV